MEFFEKYKTSHLELVETAILDLILLSQCVFALALATERFILVVKATEAKAILTKHRRMCLHSAVVAISVIAPLMKHTSLNFLQQNAIARTFLVARLTVFCIFVCVFPMKNYTEGSRT